MSETGTAGAEIGGGRGGRRWLGVALVVSICGNLLLAGLIAGVWMRNNQLLGEGVSRREATLMMVVPESYHAEARELMAAGRAARRESAALTGEIDAEILRILRAEPFDADALASALDARRAIRFEAGSALSDTVLALSMRMTPAERAEMADRIEALLARWKNRSRDG